MPSDRRRDNGYKQNHTKFHVARSDCTERGEQGIWRGCEVSLWCSRPDWTSLTWAPCASWPCLSSEVGLEGLSGPFTPSGVISIVELLPGCNVIRSKANPQNLVWKRKDQMSSGIFVGIPSYLVKSSKKWGLFYGSLSSFVSTTNILPFSPDVLLTKIHFLMSVVHLFILVHYFTLCKLNVFCYGQYSCSSKILSCLWPAQ